VVPEEEGEDIAARREAILKPRLLKEFFERYRRAKLPNDVIAVNVLKSLGLPADRVESALEIIKPNGRYAGIIRETPTGPFVNLDSPGVPAPFDLQTVLDTLVRSAARLCDADKGFIARREGTGYRLAASFGFTPEFVGYVGQVLIEPGRNTLVGRTAR
jgi:hypothetical protein